MDKQELLKILAAHLEWVKSGGNQGTRAYLTGAYLMAANLTDANLTDANLDQEIPVIPQLDVKVLAAIEAAPERFDMSSWHMFASDIDETTAAPSGLLEAGAACGTTHCRAGWAIHLAGEAGYALEKRVGPHAAGTLIYLKSTGRVPSFSASGDDALEDIRACAAKQLAEAK